MIVQGVQIHQHVIRSVETKGLSPYTKANFESILHRPLTFEEQCLIFQASHKLAVERDTITVLGPYHK